MITRRPTAAPALSPPRRSRCTGGTYRHARTPRRRSTPSRRPARWSPSPSTAGRGDTAGADRSRSPSPSSTSRRRRAPRRRRRAAPDPGRQRRLRATPPARRSTRPASRSPPPTPRPGDPRHGATASTVIADHRHGRDGSPRCRPVTIAPADASDRQLQRDHGHPDPRPALDSTASLPGLVLQTRHVLQHAAPTRRSLTRTVDVHGRRRRARSTTSAPAYPRDHRHPGQRRRPRSTRSPTRHDPRERRPTQTINLTASPPAAARRRP